MEHEILTWRNPPKYLDSKTSDSPVKKDEVSGGAMSDNDIWGPKEKNLPEISEEMKSWKEGLLHLGQVQDDSPDRICHFKSVLGTSEDTALLILHDAAEKDDTRTTGDSELSVSELLKLLNSRFVDSTKIMSFFFQAGGHNNGILQYAKTIRGSFRVLQLHGGTIFYYHEVFRRSLKTLQAPTRSTGSFEPDSKRAPRVNKVH
ncbi:hypothetical protein M406DRAFT_358404, partial [Cryphonectria parasitica EP155]